MVKRICESESNRTECKGNERFEGFCIDLLKLLSDRYFYQNKILLISLLLKYYYLYRCAFTFLLINY